LRQYQLCVDVLQRELGVEPEEATKQVYRELLPQPSPRLATPQVGLIHCLNDVADAFQGIVAPGGLRPR
jgi:hypothetical protein